MAVNLTGKVVGQGSGVAVSMRGKMDDGNKQRSFAVEERVEGRREGGEIVRRWKEGRGGDAMDAYRGVAKLLERRQVAPGATVSLAVRAWAGTGFVGITPHTAWGKNCAGQSTGVLGRRDRRAHRTDHSRRFCAGAAGR